MNPLLRVMQSVSLHYYVVITYYYAIITMGSIITHYYLFLSPELADVKVNKIYNVPTSNFHLTERAQDRAPTNCRTNWQSSKQLKPRHHFSCFTTTFRFSESVRLTEIVQNVMADFCSGDFAVWEAPASLKQCIEVQVILCIELEQSYCENLVSVPAVFAIITCYALSMFSLLHYYPFLPFLPIITCYKLGNLQMFTSYGAK